MKYFIIVMTFLLPQYSYAEMISNIHLTSDYIYRGISNSARNPAVQGGLDYYNDFGIYTGVWASTVDYELVSDEPSYEFDVYGGMTGELASIGWDVGFLYFTYPNASSSYQLDAHEFHIGLSRDVNDVSITTAYHYSPEYSGAGNSHYIEANIDILLPDEFNLSLHAGHQSFENNYWYDLPDYTDWKIVIGREISGILVELSWTDTNIKDNNACFSGTDWCGSQFTLDVHRDFNFF